MGGTVRTTFKNREYFDQAISYNMEAIARFQRVIADSSTDPKHRKRLLYSTYNRSVERLISLYSRGDAIETMQAPFQEIVATLASYLGHQREGTRPDDFKYLGQYMTSLWMVSLGILLDVEDSTMRELVALLGNEGRDGLYEFIVGARVSGRAKNAPLMHPAQFTELGVSLHSDAAERPTLINAFLTSYYKRMSELAWYDTHLKADPVFFGYWSFEAAAVVKILKVPDAFFRDNIYYPRDLASR